MDRESLLQIIANMQKEGRLIDVSLSGHINCMLRAGKVEEVYQLLDKNNIIIILRSIVRQYLRLYKNCDLKLKEFDEIVKEKGLEKEVLIAIYRQSIKENISDTLVIVCDLLQKQN